MRVIMFKPQFTEKILSGQKVSTIRPKARCEPGDDLSLRNWEGNPYRSKHKPIMDVMCRETFHITIDNHMIRFHRFIVLTTDGSEPEQIAKREGFNGFKEMLDFFKETHGLPFTGDLISWMKTPYLHFS